MTSDVDYELVRMLDALRTSHPDMEQLYMYGQCYNLFRIIRTIRPQAEAWYCMIEGHIYTRVGVYWYDIRGVHYKISEYASKLDHRRSHKPHRWGKDDDRRLVDTYKTIQT